MIALNRPKAYVYAADIAPLRNPDLFDKAYRAVSEERRRKTDKKRFQKDKYLSLGAELLLMRACRDFGVDYGKEHFLTDAFSKPGFADCPLYFNLSHSGERVMCIMSDLPVGCDVEKRHPIDLGLAERFFSEREHRAIEACETQQARETLFFRLWTLKESFMKCTGLGFRLPMNAFSVSVTPEGIRAEQSVDDKRYLFFESDPQDGCQYAWCIRVPEKEPFACDGAAELKRIEFGCDLHEVARTAINEYDFYGRD